MSEEKFLLSEFLKSRGFIVGLVVSILMMLIQLSIDWTNVNLTLWGMNASIPSPIRAGNTRLLSKFPKAEGR